MILRVTTVHENARSASECGPPRRDAALECPRHKGQGGRRRQAAALQGAFGTAIVMAARNLALNLRSAIRPQAERDSSLRSE
jgi:hypothetical protein